MAYKEDETLRQLNNFTRISFVVRFFRVVFFGYASLCFIFCFLNFFEVDWLNMFSWLFIGPYWVVSRFYTPKALSLDFSLAIVGGFFVLLGMACDPILNKLYGRILELREEMDRKNEKRKMIRAKKKIAKPVMNFVEESNKTENPFENSKLLFLILPNTKKIKRKKEDMELTFQEVEIWKQRVNKKLIENVNYSNPIQKGYYRKNLFLVYNDFNYVDDFIYYISPTLQSISMEFKKYGINVSYCYVLSAISDINTLEKELDCMDTTLALNFVNEFIVTNRFKVTYDYKTTKKYKLILKGEYNLSKNLSISNRQPLYTLTDIKKEETKK